MLVQSILSRTWERQKRLKEASQQKDRQCKVKAFVLSKEYYPPASGISEIYDFNNHLS